MKRRRQLRPRLWDEIDSTAYNYLRGGIGARMVSKVKEQIRKNEHYGASSLLFAIRRILTGNEGL